MSAYSLHLLVSCSRRSGGESYIEVAKRCYGGRMEARVLRNIAYAACRGSSKYQRCKCWECWVLLTI